VGNDGIGRIDYLGQVAQFVFGGGIVLWVIEEHWHGCNRCECAAITQEFLKNAATLGRLKALLAQATFDKDGDGLVLIKGFQVVGIAGGVGIIGVEEFKLPNGCDEAGMKDYTRELRSDFEKEINGSGAKELLARIASAGSKVDGIYIDNGKAIVYLEAMITRMEDYQDTLAELIADECKDEDIKFE
jgi:hypothetical protein